MRLKGTRLAKKPPRLLTDTNPPTFLVEDSEIDDLADFPQDVKLPFAGYVDEEGRTHFELNVWGWTPEFSRWKKFIWALRPELFLAEFFERMLATSLFKKKGKIVAAVAGMYYGAEKKGVIHYLATRPRTLNDLPDGHEVRIRGMQIMAEQLDRFLKWLGAGHVESTSCIIPVEKMKRIGWSIKPIGFTEKFKIYRQGFPVSIRRTPRIFVKYYPGATPLEKAHDNSNKNDQRAA